MDSLTSLVKTTHKREVFLNLLDRCVAEKDLSSFSLNDDFDQILKIIGVNSANDVTDQLLQRIKSELLQAPTVRISVNSVLSTSFINRLHALLFREGVGLLDIEINSISNGGFVLYKDGKVFNYSFEHLISNLFVEEAFKQKIATYL